MKAVYVDHMGDDNSVANAARVSFDKLASMFSKEENERLIRFLARGCSTKDWKGILKDVSLAATTEELEDLLFHIRNMPCHWTPFAHNAITLRMQAPAPIRTQCFKHKQGLVENEESRRYISSTPEVFIPDEIRCAPTDGAKQGSQGIHPNSHGWRNAYKAVTSQAVRMYEEMIKDGVCPEQARFVLPQGCEVNWIWTGNLFAFANFYNKRTDPHAQLEIQQLAKAVGEIIEPLFPISWAALTGKEVSTRA